VYLALFGQDLLQSAIDKLRLVVQLRVEVGIRHFLQGKTNGFLTVDNQRQ